ncbi:MAG: hypothetical protein ABI889_12850, partial [Gemmatimonadota bacterium]
MRRSSRPFARRWPHCHECAAEYSSTGRDGHARLTALLDAQVYALVFWRRAAHEINYRRFFDINELVALRMEDPAVFGATHRRIIQWVKNGQLDGLRIDHVDGLRNPRAYLERLNAAIHQVLPGVDMPIFVEKILSWRERLRPEWPVAGTTGYEFLAKVDAIFVSPEGRADIEHSYRAFLGIRRPELGFHEVAVRGKAFMLRGSLASDVQRLARFLAPIARADERTQSLTRAQLAEGIARRARARVPRGELRRPHSRTIALAPRTALPRRHALGERRVEGTARRVRAEISAGERTGNGKGDRGYGTLSLLAASLAQRGRRGSRGRAPGRGRLSARHEHRAEHAV